MPVPIEFHTAWRKSSFSGGDANCVEIAFGTWRKSSTSGPDSNCVEVTYAAEVLAVRDSKNPEGGYLVWRCGGVADELYGPRVRRPSTRVRRSRLPAVIMLRKCLVCRVSGFMIVVCAAIATVAVVVASQFAIMVAIQPPL